MRALLNGQPFGWFEVCAGEVRDRHKGRLRDVIRDIKDLGYFALAMFYMSSNQNRPKTASTQRQHQ
jgi:hypothetical protein